MILRRTRGHLTTFCKLLLHLRNFDQAAARRRGACGPPAAAATSATPTAARDARPEHGKGWKRSFTRPREP